MAYTGISAGQPIKASDVTNALDSKADKTTVDDIGISIDDIYAAIGVLDFFPVGAILIFSGSAYSSASAAFKQKWKICNGKSGTPDLVNKFLRGAESSGSAAGADSQNITLQTINLPSHSHKVTTLPVTGLNTSGLSIASSGGHAHSVSGYTDSTSKTLTGTFAGVEINTPTSGIVSRSSSNKIGNSTADFDNDLISIDATHSHTITGSTANSGSHTHAVSGSITGGGVSGSTDNAGSGTAFTVNTVPAYYTVIYIIKVA